MTGAPRNFVHVAFFANHAGEFAEPYYIDGGNRGGRPAELKQRLLGELKRAFRDITGVPAGQLGAASPRGRHPGRWRAATSCPNRVRKARSGWALSAHR